MFIARNFFRLIKKLQRRIDFLLRKIYVAPSSYIDPNVLIGSYTRINNTSHIGKCTIGAYCAIGGRLVVRSADHYACYLNIQDWAQKHLIESNFPVSGKKKGQVEIGNAVWIGDSVIILPDVKIGDGAIIGAGSVVTKSIPPYAVAVGNPARVIKKRFTDDILEIIVHLKWWEWDKKTIRKRRELFETDLTTISPTQLMVLLDKLEIDME